MLIAEAVKKCGATILRGGAYKPRTSPYSFQGLEEEGLRYMQEAGKAFGLATICEVVSLEAIEAAVKYVDMIQIGARNMQNFILLKKPACSGLPVLLKRGLCATIDENSLNVPPNILWQKEMKMWFYVNAASVPMKRPRAIRLT